MTSRGCRRATQAARERSIVSLWRGSPIRPKPSPDRKTHVRKLFVVVFVEDIWYLARGAPRGARPAPWS